MASTDEVTRLRPAFGRLRFPRDLETVYADSYLAQALPRARFAIWLAVVLFALFGILDAYIVPDEAPTIWLIRFGVVCPLGLVTIGLSFAPSFPRVMQSVLSTFAVIGGLGIVAMIAIADPPGAYQYYAGLVLVIFWIFTLLQLRFSFATAACLVIVVGYEVVAIWAADTPVEILLSNNFFFLSAAILGVAAGYTIELGKRTGFLQRRLIDRQRAELADRNAQLDSALQDSLDEVRRQAAELQASRARIVVAGDVERRRIERNLHDGAQQQLLALAVQLTVAESYVGRDEQALRDLLFQVKCGAQGALDELRDLARGIYPPLLADHGLVVALESQAEKVPLPVECRTHGVGRYASEVEAAVYFSVLEALQNVVKYANATKADVMLSGHGDRVSFEVRDDGRGFDTETVTRGIGLQSMEDRLQALGGALEVRAVPGEGTSIRGTVPSGSGRDALGPALDAAGERTAAAS
jgi:signal transduction histidine kinase